MDKNITHFRIPDSVTSIEDDAFYGCAALQSIDIPKSVTRIGKWAFNNCTSLDSIDLPNNITEISTQTFANCSALKHISIPDNVREIGGYAFYNCRSLKSVKLPNGLTKIRSGAFSDCSALESITLPDSVKSIWGAAFSGCSALKYINIPYKVNWIGASAFSGCSALERIDVSKGNRWFISIDGVLFDKSLTKVIRVPMGRTRFSFPKSVTTIGEYAFEGCYALQTINVPNGVTTIEEGAFKDCKALQCIRIPNSITTIGNDAFEGVNTYACALEIPLETDWPCKDHVELTKFTNINPITKELKFSEDGKTIIRATDKCITRITIPDYVTVIDNCAFIHCPSLQIVNIPDSVEKIGLGAFAIISKTAALQCVNVSFNNNHYTSVDGVLFNKDLTTIITFPRGKTFKEYKIPNNVKTIDSGAFWGCSSLQEIAIPDGVRAIEDEAFSFCTSLQSIRIPKSVTEINDWVFRGCTALRSIHIHITNIENANISAKAFEGIDPDNCVLYIPPGTQLAYRSHAAFSKFRNIEIAE